MTQDIHGLAAAEYNRKRWQPIVNDLDFIALTDLRKALELIRSDENIRILDFGAGGSPYRLLFPKADYRRADCVNIPGLDFHFGEDEKIAAPDESFDLVLSTQVLEHVRHPQTYLREAWRLLKHGGKIVVSTHGLFEEHGVPVDYRRWTLEGLFCELEDAGFQREKGWKLTCGPRVLLFWLIRHGWLGRPTNKSVFGACWNVVRTIMTRNIVWINRQADRHFQYYSVVEAKEDATPIYLGVLAVGSKGESL